MRNIDIQEFKKLLNENQKGLEIIDVREEDEFEIIHIKNSKLIPMMGIQNRLSEIDWNKTVVFVCRSGARSGYVARSLNGDYESLNLEGGIGACYQDPVCRQYLEVDEEKVGKYF
ncbi:MAG: rhodanese-like domain-containing protein [Candidatus Magasanikbacteria bacterium]|nr:rhodanese-like domain-containing protein [Candidatus Magasanikbacteria bacterium]